MLLCYSAVLTSYVRAFSISWGVIRPARIIFGVVEVQSMIVDGWPDSCSVVALSRIGVLGKIWAAVCAVRAEF